MSQFDLDNEFEWLTTSELQNNRGWWDIYHDSFPVSEQDCESELLNALDSGIAKIGCYKINGQIAAIAVTYPIKNPAFLFLHYFAVAKEFRNHGLGGRLFEVLAKNAAKNGHQFGLIWEVEDSDFAETDEEKQLQARRIGFYKRHGGHMLHNRFIQPPIDGKTYVPMRLMCHQSALKHHIHQHEQSIAQAIYFEKYQAVNGLDTELLMDLLTQCYPNYQEAG